ncbi:NAD(P)/FAD-dependent oxidoreductase [Azospirillum picis]|uniref:Gamma-glutamylputrescine oxidase n=1 Tax=Azospirillum picis TaxID=488438 RepID=A0ABU0MI87_9PROT|nr:FAD-binding oxidoreductase [Azospirillum picis]MBP2299256.1 gamma-glutamylputrescine oxidase [Azospirillum picis]MDQ0533106.1 gamma-glutamylputrescine oxidase [Azospirillum picis]
MPKPTYLDSWYAASANPQASHPPLEGELSCDVCVVGGGYTGLTAALELAERGYDVVLLEAEHCGWGASGRNGGQIITGYNKPMATIEGWVGKEDAHRLWDFGEEAKAQLADRVERHAIACDLTWGFAFAALKPRHMEDVAALEREMRDGYGYDRVRRLDRDGIRTHVASDLYIGGLYDEGSGHLHPLNYALGLARAAAAAGVRIFECSRALAIDSGAAPRVRTAGGAVTAKHLILAGNAYLGRTVPGLERTIMPVATYMIATEPLGEDRAMALMPTNIAASDMKFSLDYFRRSADHRLLFGGGVSYSGLDAPGLKQAMRQKMLTVFPGLRDVRVDHCWGGHVAITMNRMPHLGRLSPTTLFAHGYSGHGVALAGMAGRVMAEAVAGTAERFDVFARVPHHAFPGGRRFRTPALVLAMMWFRLRDLL